MGILSTLGSLALTAYRAAPAVKAISKAVTTPKKTSSGGSFVSKSPTQNQDYQKLMQNITPSLESLGADATAMNYIGKAQDANDVRTGVGGAGAGQTVDSISKGFSMKGGYDIYEENKAYTRAVQEVKSIEADNSFETKRAKEMTSSFWDFFTGAQGLMGNTKNIDGKSVSELKIARDKAIKDVVDFKNPNSALHQSFKKNIESQGYDYQKDFKDYVSEVNQYVEGMKADKSNAYESSGIRGFYDLPIIRASVNKATGGEYGKFTDAIDQAQSEGVTDLTSKGAYITSNLLGGGLLYGSIGGVVSKGLGGASALLSEGGFSVGGRVGGNMVVAANRIRAIEQASPTLYAIAVDNPLTTAIDYGVTKSMGGRYSGEDVSNALIMGTIIPVGLKGATSGLSGIYKGLTTKQLSSIDTEVAKLTKDGAMTPNDALLKVANEFEFEPGKTIADAMDEAGVEPRTNISGDEVRASLGASGINTSSIASKKIASVIENLNKKIRKATEDGDVIGGGYGEIGTQGNAVLAKQSIMNELAETKVIDGKQADEIIKRNLEANGMAFSPAKSNAFEDVGDVIDDAMHNPKFSGSKLKGATTMDEIGEALTGEVNATAKLQDIASARANVSTNMKDAETSVRDVAAKAGINIDEGKLLTKIDDGDGGTTLVLNKKYAEDILYRSEVRATGYNGARSSALSRTKRLIEDGALSMRKGVGELNRKLKLAATEYKGMRTSASDALVGNQSYSHLDIATRKRIVDSAMKPVSGSVDSLIARTQIADEKLHIATFRKLETDADAMVKDINKKSKSRTKKNTIDMDKEEEIILAHKQFNESKLKGDLDGMKKVYEDMKLFAQEGRSIYKEDIAIRKESAKISSMRVVDELKAQGIDEFETRLVNTPSSGDIQNKRGFIDSVKSTFEDLLPTHQQFVRYFGKDSIVTNKMYKAFSAAESKTQLVSHKLMGNWASTLGSIKKGIKGDEDSLIKQYTLWRNSKSKFNTKDGAITGHEYNKKNDMLGYYDKDGNPQLITILDGDGFRKKNMEKIRSGEIIDFWAKNGNDAMREDFLSKVYSRFDNLYSTSKDFAKGEDFFRNHFDANGKKNAAIMKRAYNKSMDLVDTYNPLYIYGKSHNDRATGELGEIMGESFRETVDASHTISRVGPGQDVRMVLDFSTLLERHINGSVHWGNVIEPLNEAESMLRMMKKGKSFITNEADADNIIAKEMGDDPFAVIEGRTNVFTADAKRLGERLMTPEVERFLAENLKKYATRGGSISGSGVHINQGKTLGTLFGRAYKTMLTWWTTGAKQVLSDVDISTLAGAKAWTTSTRSAGTNGNWSFLLDESGLLLDRQAERFSGAIGKKLTLKGNRKVSDKILDALDVPADLILGNVVKGVDGMMSYKTLIAGISKTLDERYPNLHKSGGSLNLSDIKQKLTKVEIIDGVRVIDDSAWKDVLTDGELFMHQVMSSNSMVDDSLGSKGVLGKITTFMGKSATNRMVAHWDSMVHNGMKRQLAGEALSGDAKNKIRTMGYWVTGSLVATAYTEWMKSLNQGYDEWSGKKEVGSAKENPFIALATKKDAESFANFTSAWIESQFFMPQTTFDVTESMKSIKDASADFGKQESTSGKIRAGGAIAASIVPMHGRVTDAFKKGVNDLTGFDMRKAGLKTEADASSKVKTSYGEEKFNSLTQDEKNVLIDKQKELSEASKKVSATSPSTIQGDFVDSITGGKSVMSREEFIQKVIQNPSVRATLANEKDAEKLYNKYEAKMAKTSGERDSILMGKSTDVIYESEILPLMEQGKAGDAYNRVMELRQKGVIKSDKGAIQILTKMKAMQNNQ